MPKINVCGGCHMTYLDDFDAYRNAPVFGALDLGVCGICGQETGIMAEANVKRPVLKRIREEEASRNA